jgi:peptide chain release factor 2
MIQELQERIATLRMKVEEAWHLLGLDTVKNEIEALEAATMAPDFWTNQERAKKEGQQLAELKRSFEGWNTLRMSLLECEELGEMLAHEMDESLQEELIARLRKLDDEYLKREFELMFSGAHDASSAIISIHAGAGGTDAQDWAEMLMRMFARYAERKGWTIKLLDESRGGEAGIKSATMMIEGRYVYGNLRSEAGVHRLVRQSPFNSDALRQTSFALVEVIPEINEDVSVEIRPEDLRVDTFMSGGKGGQSVNTTYSAVRIVHLPTKITVTCQNERSQTQNRETAMKILKAKLVLLKEEALAKEKQQLRGEFHSAEWGSQIRSYVLHPYKMVKDHRTEAETSDPEAVLDGNLDQFVEAYLRWQTKSLDRSMELNRE